MTPFCFAIPSSSAASSGAVPQGQTVSSSIVTTLAPPSRHRRKWSDHDAEVARDRDDRDVGPAASRARRASGSTITPAELPEPGDLAEVAPDLVRATCDGADDLDTLLEHQPSRDRAHGADAVHDRPMGATTVLMAEGHLPGVGAGPRPARSIPICTIGDRRPSPNRHVGGTDTWLIRVHARVVPDRRSLRLQNYDYSWAGVYFVTICARDGRCLFGRIRGDRIGPYLDRPHCGGGLGAGSGFPRDVRARCFRRHAQPSARDRGSGGNERPEVPIDGHRALQEPCEPPRGVSDLAAQFS